MDKSTRALSVHGEFTVPSLQQAKTRKGVASSRLARGGKLRRGKRLAMAARGRRPYRPPRGRRPGPPRGEFQGEWAGVYGALFVRRLLPAVEAE